MTAIVATAVLAASRTAMHGMLMVLVIVFAAVAFGVIRWRHRRDEAQAQMQAGMHDLPPDEKSSEQKEHSHTRPGG